VSHDPSEIILICWFYAQYTFPITINVGYFLFKTCLISKTGEVWPVLAHSWHRDLRNDPSDHAWRCWVGNLQCAHLCPLQGKKVSSFPLHIVSSTFRLTKLLPPTLLKQNGSSEKRELRQFQFMAWPDHGVPEYPPPILAFLRRVKACNPPDAGPMVVHCRWAPLPSPAFTADLFTLFPSYTTLL